jgi:tetratricopeptide (TPR) repeat protein
MRFFRRNSGIHYEHAVHNKAVFGGGCAATDVKMNHYGYSLDPDKMEAKRRRTEALLMERLDEDPKDHAALYYMAQMRIGQKRYKEAEDYGMRFFRCVPVGPEDFQFYGVMYFYMAWNALHMGDGNKALSWTQKGLEFYPDDIDLNYMAARIGYQAKIDGLLREHGKKYLNLLPSVRNRGAQESDQFVSPMDDKEWFNRTVYTADEAAESDIKKFMEVLN